MPAFSFIDRQPQLEQAIKELSQQKFVCIDTESSSFYTYESELCLIQISAGKHHYLIDVLSGMNLGLLDEIFADPTKTMVLHTAASDISELRRVHKYTFGAIFDVMVGGRMIGLTSVSLQSLVKHYTGKDMEKTEQKSNWKKRPLSASQLEYAHRDTIYLEEIMTRMTPEIVRYGFQTEFDQEMIRVSKESIPSVRVFDPEGWKALPNALMLNPSQRGFLKVLFEIREMRAKKENIAPFRLASNENLVRTAERSPDSLSELQEMGFHPDFVKKEADRILEARNRAPEIRNVDIPRDKRKPADQIIANLKRWRKDVADFRGFDPSMILSNRQIDFITEKKPATITDLGALDILTPWKVENYGQSILAILGGADAKVPVGITRIPPEARRV